MKLRLTNHAVERLFERNISPKDCEEVYFHGTVIETYPDDLPFPSELRLGKVGSRVIHLVTAIDGETVHVITAYEPDPQYWEKNFTRRRKKR